MAFGLASVLVAAMAAAASPSPEHAVPRVATTRLPLPVRPIAPNGADAADRVTLPDAVRPGESAAAPTDDAAVLPAEEDGGDDADFSGAVVGPPEEVVAAQRSIVAELRPNAVRAAAAAGVTPSPSPTRPPTPPPNPTPTLAWGRHPAAPAFPTWIDPWTSYESESTCDPVAKPGASDLVRLLRDTYGSAIATNIVRACSTKKTGHKEGRAVDWMVNSRNSAQAAAGDAFVAWLLAPDAHGTPNAMARRLGVMYVIWRGRSYALYSGTWREYDHCLTTQTGKDLDNTCHRNHVHVSLTWAGARRQTSWWTLAHGLPTCNPALPTTWGPWVRTGTSTGVRWVRLVDTAAGTGTPKAPLPCLAGPASVIGIPVAGLAGLPAKGIAAVQVRVIARGRGTVSSISRLGPPNIPPHVESATSLVVPAGGAVSTTMWLAVHVSGTAYLRVGPAPVDAQVDVMAWSPVVPILTPKPAPTATTRAALPRRVAAALVSR